MIIEKRLNRRHFFIDEKNLQKLGLTGELISAYLYYMIILSFQSNYLTTVKQCLTIFFSKDYVLLGRSPIDEAKTSKELLKKQKH